MERQEQGAAAGELVVAGLAMLGGMLAAIAIGRGWGLFTSPAWLDEYHSLFVAGRGTLRTGLTALAEGADFSPPLLPIVHRAIGAFSGGLDVTGREMLPLRLFSFGCMWGALVAVYAVLRHRFDTSAAFVGAFSLWTHPLFVQHSFEARYYGPWLLCTALFVCAVLGGERERAPWRDAAIAASATALCLIHYFGLFTWSLVIGAQFLRLRSRDSRSAIRALAPSALGPLALAACLPLYLGQRASLTVATWVQPPTLDIVFLYPVLLFWRLLVLAGVVWVTARLLGPAPQSSPRQGMSYGRASSVALLLALGLMPIVLIIFSMLIQPTLIDRFAIVGILACAPIVAESLARLERRWRPMAIAGCIVLAIAVVSARVERADEGERMYAALARALETQVEPETRIVVDERYTLYPLASRVLRSLAESMVYPELADSMRTRVRDYDIVERDVARVHARLYGFPTLRPIEELRRVDRFWLVTRADSTVSSDRRFPTHTARYVAPHLFELRLTIAALGASSTPDSK